MHERQVLSASPCVGEQAGRWSSYHAEACGKTTMQRPCGHMFHDAGRRGADQRAGGHRYAAAQIRRMRKSEGRIVAATRASRPSALRDSGRRACSSRLDAQLCEWAADVAVPAGRVGHAQHARVGEREAFERVWAAVI